MAQVLHKLVAKNTANGGACFRASGGRLKHAPHSALPFSSASPSFPLFPPPTQQLFSCQSWKVEPSCFSPSSSQRHKQELTELLTSINTGSLFYFFFCSPGSLSLGCWLCTDLILDGRLGGTLWLGCCDCVLTLLRENRLTIRRNAFMVRCLISHLCFMTFCYPCDLWCIFGALVYHLAWPLVISCLTWNIQKSCFFGGEPQQFKDVLMWGKTKIKEKEKLKCVFSKF